MRDLRAAVSIFLVGAAISVSAEEEQWPPKPHRNSPFMKDLYQRELPPDYKGILLASQVLIVAGQTFDGTKLDQFAKRKALKTFLGEPFEFSGTTEAAIAREAGESEPHEALLSRVLAAVGVRYAPPGKKITRPPGNYEEAGNGIWVLTERDRVTVRMPMVVVNGLKEPVKEVGISVDSILKCKPEDGGIFAPGTSKDAVCSGFGGREMVFDIEALRKRAIPEPIAAASIEVPTEDISIKTRLMRFQGKRDPYAREAANILAAASCQQLGTCAEIKQRAAPRNFVLLSAALAIALGLATLAVKPREEKGWFIPAVAVFLVASAFVQFVCTLGIVGSTGIDAAMLLIFLLYSAIPHLIALLVVGASVLRGTVTRLRVLALGMGLLGPALIGAGLIFFVSLYPNA